MSDPAPAPTHRFQILWEGRLAATFELATGLDPWGRWLGNVTDKLKGDVEDAARGAFLPGSPYRDGGMRQTATFRKGTIVDPAFEAWATGEDSDVASAEPPELSIELVDDDGRPTRRFRLRQC
ncbi:MAG TPA: hypothetical protein VKA30_06705, partial [Actinomycetota bacterium]|nr:hypothetical protein [Actinomycetota bacterium]